MQALSTKFPLFALAAKEGNNVTRFFAMTVGPSPPTGCVPLFSTAELAAQFYHEHRVLAGDAHWGQELHDGSTLASMLRYCQEHGCTLAAIDPPIEMGVDFQETPIADILLALESEK